MRLSPLPTPRPTSQRAQSGPQLRFRAAIPTWTDRQTDGRPLPAHPLPSPCAGSKDVNLEVTFNTHKQAVLLVGDCQGFFTRLLQTDGRPRAVNTPNPSTALRCSTALCSALIPHLGLQGGRWESSEPPLYVGHGAKTLRWG